MLVHRLQDEIDEVMGSRTDVEYEDLSRLTYCGQVFKEILRLYPVGPGTARENAEEIILEGHRIPAKSNLVVSYLPNLVSSLVKSIQVLAIAFKNSS